MRATRMAERLTRTQEKVLEFIRKNLDRGEPPPTHRELCKHFGWSSTGSARDVLRAIARKGHLARSGPRRHRHMQLRDRGAPIARVAVVGRVVAGLPVASEEFVEGQLPVPEEWVAKGTCFALRVAGDSMKDAGICEGDLVVVRQQATADDGDIVAVTVHGETTLKRLRFRGRRASLVAENRRYRPIAVDSELLVVHGVVVGLLRNYTKRHPRGVAPRRMSWKEDANHAHGS